MAIDQILGISARTVDKAMAAAAEGADYLGVGSMYPTTSKESAEVVGPAGLRLIRQAVSLPLVAIGGITPDNADEVIAAGADSVAVISALLNADDLASTASRLAGKFEVKK